MWLRRVITLSNFLGSSRTDALAVELHYISKETSYSHFVTMASLYTLHSMMSWTLIEKKIPTKSDHTIRYPWIWGIFGWCQKNQKNCFGYLIKSKMYYINRKPYEVKKRMIARVNLHNKVFILNHSIQLIRITVYFVKPKKLKFLILY